MEATLTSNKRDKRQIKHSLLLSKLRSSAKVSKSRPASASERLRTGRISKASHQNALKRQRARRRKNLSANLSDLAAVLPETTGEGNSFDDTTSCVYRNNSILKVKDKQSKTVVLSAEGIRQRKPGFQRRMGLIADSERRRFGENLASMSLPSQDKWNTSSSNTSSSKVEIRDQDTKNFPVNDGNVDASTTSPPPGNRWEALRSHISQHMVLKG